MTGSAKRLKDFEWASATRYIVYISEVAGLTEMTDTAVYSFVVSRYGMGGLLRVKQKTADAIHDNMIKLEEFVTGHEGGINKLELAIIRSMYRSLKKNLEIVDTHIATCINARIHQEDYEQLSIFAGHQGDEEETDVPF